VTLPPSRAIGILLALVVGGLTLALWPRKHLTPQELIKRNVDKMCQSAEDRKIAGVMAFVSERFKSQDGWSREDARGVITRQLLLGTWVRVYTTNVEVTLTSDTTADFKGRFVFGRFDAEKSAAANGSDLTAYEIAGRLERETDGEWRFVWALPRQLEPGGLF
jgi:hypothetical protein